MAIKFEEEKIVKKEKDSKMTFVGYFSPNEELIDYNIYSVSNHHDNWRNSVSLTFLAWVSYILKDTNVNNLSEDLKINNMYPGINEIVKFGYDEDSDINYYSYEVVLNILLSEVNYLKELYRHNKPTGYALFEYDLMLFFEKAYSNKTFFETIGRKFSIENPNSVKEKLRNKYKDYDEYDINDLYQNSVKKQLLSYLKDICVQYLGYDSIERFKPNGEPIVITDNYNFLDNPRVITTSYKNVNDRFYNYLLMDWVVNREPIYRFNSNTNMYELDNNYYVSENEEMLGKEIESIKKHVLKKDRYKYFRN